MFVNNNTFEMNGLQVVHYAPNRLNVTTMDFLTMETISARAHLDAHPDNFVIFSGSLVTFLSLDALEAAFEYGTVFSCVKGDGLVGDSDLDDQLFNTTSIGVAQAVFIPLDQAIAMQALIHQNQRAFAITDHPTRTVQFAASVHAYESGEGTQDSKHCEPGSGAHVKDLLAVHFAGGTPYVSPNVNMTNRFYDQVFVQNADAIIRGRTASMNHPLVGKILAASQSLGLQGLRSLLNLNVRWIGDTSDIDKNIVKLVAMFQPTIQKVLICHGHPTHRHNRVQFINNLRGISKFSLLRRDVHNRTEHNGFEIRAVVSSLQKHASTLTYMYLDEIDSAIPTLASFTHLLTLHACFDDSRFLHDVFSHPSLENLKLKSTRKQAYGAGEEFVLNTTRSRVRNILLDLPKFAGDLSHIVNIPNLIKVKIIAPMANTGYISRLFSHPTLRKLTIHSEREFDTIVDDSRASKIRRLSLRIPNYRGSFNFLMDMRWLVSSDLPLLPPDVEDRAIATMAHNAANHP